MFCLLEIFDLLVHPVFLRLCVWEEQVPTCCLKCRCAWELVHFHKQVTFLKAIMKNGPACFFNAAF